MNEITIRLEKDGLGRGNWRVYGIVERERKLIEDIDERFYYKKSAKKFISELKRKYA